MLLSLRICSSYSFEAHKTKWEACATTGDELSLAQDKSLRSAMASSNRGFPNFVLTSIQIHLNGWRVFRFQGLGENLRNLSVFIYLLSKAVPKTTRLLHPQLGLRVHLKKNEEVMNVTHTLVRSSFVGSLFNYFWPELAKCQNAHNI